MKTKILFLGLVIGLLGIVSKMEAQVTGTGTMVAKGAVGSGEEEDYVTINSTMPYKVTPFDWGTMASIMNPSIYKWAMTTGTSGTDWSLFSNDGSTALTDLTSATPSNPNYYSQNEISIKWLKSGVYTINVTERSQPKVGTGCEQAIPENLKVNVLPWPTAANAFASATDPSACGLSGNVNIAIAATGSRSITVSYDVYHTALATGSARQKLTASPSTVTLTNSGYNAAATGNITYSVSNGSGKYEIEIVNIVDVVTEKSFGALTATAAARNATSTELPSSPFVFYSIPTPTTQPIQHIKNL